MQHVLTCCKGDYQTQWKTHMISIKFETDNYIGQATAYAKIVFVHSGGGAGACPHITDIPGVYFYLVLLFDTFAYLLRSHCSP